MVENILGNYLVKTGKITDEQLQAVIQKEDETRVKMGLLAVSEGILTIDQADYINGLQATMDKRFGDIAVERDFDRGSDFQSVEEAGQCLSYFCTDTGK